MFLALMISCHRESLLVKGNDIDFGFVNFLLHVRNFRAFLVDFVRSGSLDASSLGAGKTLVAISSSAVEKS